MEPWSDPIQTAEPLSPKRPKRFWVQAAVLVAVLVFLDLELSAPKSFPKDVGVFTVASGEGLKSVATALEKAGYIRSPIVFSTIVTMLGGEHHLSPGDYQFSAAESAFGIARQIAQGDHNIVPAKITVPEGMNVTEISALLAEKIPGFDTKTFITDATPEEGYLFPETYFLYPSTTPAAVVSDMRAMFDTKTAGLFTKEALGSHTEAEIVAMASLVEREAHGDDDRATIAGILWKRIALGMRLDVDAAPETYKHGGLPTAPIANPGVEALKAAMNPTQTPYLYYLHDKNGSIHYAKTYAEHQANIKKYL